MKHCTTKWRMLSPSAQVIVDPVSSARGIIRDTRVEGAYRFHWSVIPAEEPLPIAAGRIGELARARSITEEALRIYAEDWRELVGAYSEAVSLNPLYPGSAIFDGKPRSYAVSRQLNIAKLKLPVPVNARLSRMGSSGRA